MSLADLPIENIAHIQGYLANNITQFDTRLLRACRAIREKALVHTWPPLYIHKADERAMDITNAYKFEKVYVHSDAGEQQKLSAARPGLNVELLMQRVGSGFEHRCIKNGKPLVVYNAYAQSRITVAEPMSLVLVGRCFNIHATAEYDVTIMDIASIHYSEIRLHGVQPKYIKLDEPCNSPYACNYTQFHSMYDYSVDVYGDTGSIIYTLNEFHRYFVPGSIEYMTYRLPMKYYGLFNKHRYDVQYILKCKFRNSYDGEDLDTIYCWLTATSDARSVHSEVDMDKIVSRIDARLRTRRKK